MEIGSFKTTPIFRPANAESLFGSASAQDVIAAGAAASGTSDQQSAQVIIKAHKREINRIHGYKLDLTPSELQRLRDLQEDIQEIQSKAAAGTVRQDELDDRIEFLEEADRILGKPIVDVEADETLAEYNNLRVSLLEPKLDGSRAKRVAFIERFKASLEAQINENPERHSLQLQFQSIDRQLKALKPLRSPTQLSKAESKAYDDIVGLINDHAGVKIELTVAEWTKVEALESSITKFQANLGPDPSQQPTAQAVANAYTALVR